MVSRRSRFQVKPNLGRPSQPPTPAAAEIPSGPKSPRKTVPPSATEEDNNGSEEIVAHQVVIDAEDDDEQMPCSSSQLPPHPQPPKSPFKAPRSPMKVATPHHADGSYALGRSTSSVISKSHVRRHFTGHEKLDKSKFLMSDLIYWNPKTEQGILTPGHEGKRNNRGRKRKAANLKEEIIPNQSTIAISKVEDSKKEESQPWVMPAPQVKLDAEGKMILDESSLTISHPSEAGLSKLQACDSNVPKRISSLTFRRRASTKTKVWTEEETDFFYTILRRTGCDFSLMHEFMSPRTRQELKNKYARENKRNSERITSVLNNPLPMEKSLYDLVAERNKKLAEAKQKTAKVTDDWGDSSDMQDLELEAAREIERLEAMFKKPSRYGRARKPKRISESDGEQEIDVVDSRPARNDSLVQEVLSSVRESVCSDSVPQTPSKKFPAYEPTVAAQTEADHPASAVSDRTTITVNIPNVGAVTMTPAPDNQPSHVVIEAKNAEGEPTRYVLVHEVSDQPGRKDMVHVYKLSDTPQSNEEPQSADSASTSNAHMRPLVVEETNLNS